MNHLPSKPFLFSTLLPRGSISLMFDPRHEEVQVPAQLKECAVAFLQFTPNAPHQTTDLFVDEYKVGARVAVDDSGELAQCVVPWHVVTSLRLPQEGLTMKWSLDESVDRFVDAEPELQNKLQPPRFGILDGGVERDQENTSVSALRLVT